MGDSELTPLPKMVEQPTDLMDYAAMEVSTVGGTNERWPAATAFLEDIGDDTERSQRRPDMTWSGLLAGRYELIELLSEGGMGRVFRARHRELGRQFAVKLVLEGYKHDQGMRERFFTEARLASSLNHKNIISVTDFGLDDRLGYFLVMELLEGETLRQRLERGRVSLRFACDVMDQVASAVRHIHSREVVHCDLKPENIFLTRVEGEPRRQNVVKLLDFGLSWRQGGREAKVAGTPPYLAPERLRGRAPSPQSDVYSLGLIFYELIAGGVPYHGNEREMMEQQLSGPPPPPPSLYAREPLDERADSLVARSLSREPEERQAGAEAFHYELRAFMSMMGMNVRRGMVASETSPGTVPGTLAPAIRSEVVGAAVMASPIPLAVLEPNGAFRFGNPAFFELANGGVVEARTFDALALAVRNPGLGEVLRAVAASCRPAYRVVIAGASGGEGPMLLLLSPAVKAGRVESVHATLIDTAMR
jgi:eukaryotic-like serine/threonine-protein kinase